MMDLVCVHHSTHSTASCRETLPRLSMFARVPYTTLTPPCKHVVSVTKELPLAMAAFTARSPYDALVPWSVPRQSPAASHRVEKHSAVLCRTKAGNRVANANY
ncbi:hypothetical protein V8C34DRAFT_10493 [Trichoderma compactum]